MKPILSDHDISEMRKDVESLWPLSKPVENRWDVHIILNTLEHMQSEIKRIEKMRASGWVKPPIGIKPKYVYDHQRKESLTAACDRYNDAGMDIPEEWLIELQQLQRLDNPDKGHLKDFHGEYKPDCNCEEMYNLDRRFLNSIDLSKSSNWICPAHGYKKL